MLQQKAIDVMVSGPVATLTLNRPDKHNAINLEMIRDLTRSVESISATPSVRILVIRSEGANFSAGADLNWMKQGQTQSRDQLVSESLELAALFRILYETDLLVVAALQGKVMGGALGLVATADLVIAEADTRFAFSEVKLGLVPATIAPYILQKTGHAVASDWMLTGRTFDVEEARTAGLIRYTCKQGERDELCAGIVEELLTGGPEAQKGIKGMLRELSPGQIDKDIEIKTANLIARFRISDEGQEGMKAFFEKRKSSWNETE
jgi:methylglutaconyl-CoA hydratase